MLVRAFIESLFNYCPLVWMFSSVKSLNKIENLQKRALRFLYNDYRSSYDELLHKAGNSSMNVSRIRILCVEIYKTINKLSPDFMNEIFKVKQTQRPVREKYKLNLEIPKWNQVTFGAKSLKIYGPKMWNNLPYHIKSSENLETFKTMIKNWNGVTCKCSICKSS